MTTRIVNCKKEHCDVYIGRYNPQFGKSKFGNPFKEGVDGTREEVITKYEKYILSKPELLRLIPIELKDKVLGCWCKPDACHGDVLVELADKVL